MDNIVKKCTMASDDTLTVRASHFTKFTFAVEEQGRVATLAMDGIVDVMRAISSFDEGERNRTFKCSLQEKDTMEIDTRGDYLIVRVTQGGETATVFVSTEDSKDIAEFMRVQEGLTKPEGEPEADENPQRGLTISCNLSDKDTLRVYNDGEDVALYTRGGAIVYLKGEDVVKVIRELIAYTNTCDTFEGALELTRVKVNVDLVRTPIVVVSTPE